VVFLSYLYAGKLIVL